MELTVRHVDGMRFLAEAQGHGAIMDAAPEDGGGGTALSAPQLFVAALGACVLEFVLNSRRLHHYPVDRLSVKMYYDELAGPRRIGMIEVMICLEPHPSYDMGRRLIAVARRATLLNPPRLGIRLVRR